MPQLKGIPNYADGRGKFGFWTMTSAMFCIGLGFGVAEILQAYLERVLGMGFMVAQEQMRLWFQVVFFCGIAFLVGVIVTVYDLLFLKAKQETSPARAAAAQPAS